ncbi:2-amino-4-hydroxy-6-hydroxymethyldihydropteridine diphosphokinase [Synechococcus sp. BS55D]|uniref:2-amino-4-hydroxy-6- hydroxymethyldihydropteridine diphosphokinase n=1 Tax=Synechococcus sp. BS55D TaxID=2055943 RepID=UPI00103BC7B1|nr:2-amino-4-hydroxy-6-hydroxymethyldihydropteridine diphosphokinase [Synechococcus sp. BS55D]TCD58245.1 2-amino-4-hydroxy-6-hydroxymethyldihydropteridine diphosphokinase [Synechococcus sp. BS55D]
MPATRLALALGANLPSSAGSPHQTLLAVRPQLEVVLAGWADSGLDGASGRDDGRDQGFRCAWSPLLDTAPVGGPPDQPSYLNAVVLVTGDLGDPCLEKALALLDQLHAIERQFGRDRAREQRWGPRPLDLDLLFWEELRLDHQRLQLPHPRLHLRDFVLQPLLAAMTGSASWDEQPVMLGPSDLPASHGSAAAS